MTQFLPPNLLALFAPREPIRYLPPANKLPHEKKNRGYVGVGTFLAEFEDPKDTPPPTRGETREERLERRRREREEQVAYKLEQEIAVWDPNSTPNVTGDPFKTLFVARINYDTSESKLRREFDIYGPIKKCKMATILRYSAARFLSSAPASASKRIKGPSAVSGGHEGGYKLWRNISFFVAFPAVGLCMVNCYLEHSKGEHGRPEFHAYEHLRIRNKRFPWGEGQKSLFHNEHVNALPDGYEHDE